MSRAELIYPLEKYVERELAKIQGDPCNSQILMRYYRVRSSQVKIATIVSEFIRLNELSRILAKKFEEATIQDIENLVFKIDLKKNADNTKNKYRKVLKAFFRWMKGCSPREYPPEVRWLTLKKVPLVTVTPQDLIPFEECIRISEFSSNLRDKALIQCKLDAGCRIGEILTPKIGEVEFNDNGAIIYTDGKTGNQPIILTWSAKILAVWLNNHPFKNDPNAPLWPVSSCSKPRHLSYAAARAAFINCARRAGLKKRIWFHLLKHVSSTEDSAKGMPDSYRRYKHHWTPNSRMPQVYEHLSKSIIHKIQSETWDKVVGVSKMITVNEKPLEVLRRCRRCEYENPRDSRYCNRCAFPLKESEAVEKAILDSNLEIISDKIKDSQQKFDPLLSIAG